MNVWCSKSHVWFYCCHIFEQNRFPYFLFLTHYWNLIVPEKQEDTWNEHMRCVSTLSLWGPQCGWGAFHHLWCEAATKGWVCKVASLARETREVERSWEKLKVDIFWGFQGSSSVWFLQMLGQQAVLNVILCIHCLEWIGPFSTCFKCEFRLLGLFPLM